MPIPFFSLLFCGTATLRLKQNPIEGTSENDLHPGRSNDLLRVLFAAEQPCYVM